MSTLPIIVIAKEPVPGRVKTRLCPPLCHADAAAIAAAALLDTLDTVVATPGARLVLALDGHHGSWVPPEATVIPQAAGTLADRLAGAFGAVGGPALLIGMDTPQVTPDLLARGCELLRHRNTDAVLGAAPDGGYWVIGLRRPDARVFDGIPMSTSHTAAHQRRRLRELGLAHRELPVLRDVDDYDDAVAIRALIPRSRFARAVDRHRPATASAPVRAGATA